MSARRAPRPGRAWPLARGREVLLAGLLFVVLALGFGTPALLVVGTGLVTLVLGAWVLVSLSGRGLRLRRTVVERRPRAGDDVHVDLSLSGSGRARTALRLSDWEISPGVGTLGAARVAPGTRGARRLRVRGVRRGEHTLAPARLTVKDPLGLVGATRAFGDATRLLVVPRVVPATADAHALGDRRTIRRAALGEDIAQLDGVREYRPGDPLSRVHWGQTAKRGALHTKLFHTDEAGGRVEAVLCDVSAADADPDDVEIAVTAAASLMYAATSADAVTGQRVHLWAGDTETAIACAWSDAEARLTRLRRGQGPPAEDMLRRTVRLLGPGAGVIAVTTAPTPGTWEAAKAARRRGLEAVVVLAGRAAGVPESDHTGVPVVRAPTPAALAAALAPAARQGHRRGRARV